MIKFIATILIITNIHLFLDNPINWYVMQFNYLVAIVIYSIYLFGKIKKQNVNDRSLLALFIYYLLFNVVTYWPSINGRTMLWAYAFIITIFIFRTYKINKRNYNEYSDNMKEDHVYLCLERSQKNRGVFTSLWGAPFSSISVYSGEHLYGYKWSKRTYMKRKIHKLHIIKKYVVVDTNIKSSHALTQSLDQLQGEPASRYLLPRCKCVWTIRKFLKLLGKQYKPTFLEYLPSLYARKLIGIRDEKTTG